MTDRPDILSLHPTMQCDYACPNCYMKKDISIYTEKESHFFEELVSIASKVGMSEIALAVNFSKAKGIEDKNYQYFLTLKEQAYKNNLKFSATCNYDFFKDYKFSKQDLSNINLISLSLNDYVTSKQEQKQECLYYLKELKNYVKHVNCNILLTDKMIELLKNGLAEEILKNSDSIYLIVSKPLQISFLKAQNWFSELANFLPIDSKQVLMDTCIKCQLGLTMGKCDKHKMIYVNAYGEIKHCSFDSRNLVVLEQASDFEKVYNGLYPLSLTKDCELINRG